MDLLAMHSRVYEQLGLMECERKIADALKVFLPDNFKQALVILLAYLD
jgi:hypothetical protein